MPGKEEATMSVYVIKPKFVWWLRSIYAVIQVTLCVMCLLIPAEAISNIRYVSITTCLMMHVMFWIIFVPIFIFFSKKSFEIASYKIYSDKIELEDGFFNHERVSVKIKDIEQIYYSQNFLQRIAGIGTISIIAASNVEEGYTNLKFRDIESPDIIYANIKKMCDKR